LPDYCDILLIKNMEKINENGDEIMTIDEIIKSAEHFTATSPENYISEDAALEPSLVGMQIYDAPIFAFGAANDELFTMYKDADVIGDSFMTPLEWHPGAKTVISFFMPFTERIKKANAISNAWPAGEWLQARHDGQLFLQELMHHIQKQICEVGYTCIIPSLEPRFGYIGKFIPNWSERHAAYACGLGTFGLSKGMITQKGICGRFGSLLTSLDVDITERPYSDIYEYCNMCGMCIRRCPAKAISKEGKDSTLCSAFLDKVKEKHDPRYGCGKCQVNVPCESRIPRKTGG